MRLKQYQDKMEATKEKHKKELNSIMREFAFSNNPVKVGDMVSDRLNQTIKAEKVGLYTNEEFPCCYYCGPGYTKAGKPFKDGRIERIFEDNIIMINGDKNFKKIKLKRSK